MDDDSPDIENIDFEKLTKLEEGKLFYEHFDKLPPDTQAAMAKMIYWMAERPKAAENLTQEQFEQILEETRLEVIRRRLGGKVGQILPFPGACGAADAEGIHLCWAKGIFLRIHAQTNAGVAI